MRISMMLTMLFAANAALAAPAFTGTDYSGVYDCTGQDAHEGPYTGTVTMQLVPGQSTGQYGAYSFRLDVPGYGAYLGQAAADGDRLGVYFALQDQSTKDYGTGIATMTRDENGRLGFTKYYYEAEFKGGNYGTERCVHQDRKVSGLKTPESVLQTPDGRIFVSEINGFGKDGDGQITVIEPDGKVRVYASGMDDPKGLTWLGKDLYVADKARILKVTPDGQWSVFVPETAFPAKPQFLNDMERDLPGNYLYVSDSGDLEKGGAIYRIDLKGKVEKLIDGQQDARIKAPNGLLMDDSGDVLLEVDFASGVLYSYNLKTRALTDLAEGFGGGDGLVHHANGLMYVSDWKGGKVYSVRHDEPTLVRGGFQAAADIALTWDGKFILVPDMKAGELVWVPVN